MRIRVVITCRVTGVGLVFGGATCTSASVCTTIVWRRLCGAIRVATSSPAACVCREMRKMQASRGGQIAAALNDLAMPSCCYRAVRSPEPSVQSIRKHTATFRRLACLKPQKPNIRSSSTAVANITTLIVCCAFRHCIYPYVRQFCRARSCVSR